jgi:hypothetical protein
MATVPPAPRPLAMVRAAALMAGELRQKVLVMGWESAQAMESAHGSAAWFPRHDTPAHRCGMLRARNQRGLALHQ